MQIPAELRCCVCLCAKLDVLDGECSHLLCMPCAEAGELQNCPVCSTHLAFSTIDANSALACQLRDSTVRCECGDSVPVLEADCHQCSHRESSQAQLIQDMQISSGTSALNRSTFQCPICQERNLSRQGLLDHCNEMHRDQTFEVVCPVCLAMPWGDPDHVSSDFVSHLNFRHRCDYDTLVDFEHDEDAMLQQALRASMQEDEDMLEMALQASLQDMCDSNEGHSQIETSGDESDECGVLESGKGYISSDAPLADAVERDADTTMVWAVH